MSKRNALFSVLAIVALWLCWIVAYYGVKNDYVLPSFWDACKEMGRLLVSASFWRAFGNTFLRSFWAFLVSLVVGVVMAIGAHLWSGPRAFFAPIVSVLRTIPTMAVILMLLLWTTPSVAPIIVSALVLFPAVYAAALAALDEVGEEYGELVHAFRVPLGRRVVKMYLPLAAPVFLKQAGGIFSLGLKVAISGEVLAATYRSLGGMMQEAKMFLEMPTLMALTLLVLLLGFALEGVCKLAYFLIVRWRR